MEGVGKTIGQGGRVVKRKLSVNGLMKSYPIYSLMTGYDRKSLKITATDTKDVKVTLLTYIKANVFWTDGDI